MSGEYHVVHLRTGSTPPAGSRLAVDGDGEARAVPAAQLARVFRAPWREVALVALAPGARLGPRELDDSEVMLHVTAGTGAAQLHDGPVELREGIALTLFRGELLDVTAAERLELFVVEMAGRP